REGFADVSFRLGGRQGAKAIVVAVLFPIAIGLISYGIAWTAGLAHFSPQPDALAAWLVGDSTPPIVVFVINLALAPRSWPSSAPAWPQEKRSAGAGTCSPG